MRVPIPRSPVQLPTAKAARAGLAVGATLGSWLLASLILPNGAPPGVVLIGAILGSASALSAVGLVLVWKSARIVNFAIGAMGAATGVTCIRLHTAWGWPYPVALVIGVAAGVIVGIGVDALVMRRFTNAPRLIASVATLGLAQLLGGVELLLPGALFRDDPGVVTIGGFETPLSALKIQVGAHVIDGNHLLIAIAAPVIVAGLVVFLRRSLTGTAIRGAAENREWARLLGIRVARLSLCSWGVVGGLAAATYLLQAPFTGTMPQAAAGATSLMLPLAAALIARLESLPIACASAVLLGSVMQVARWNSPRAPALADVVVFVVILGVLLVRRAGGSRASDRENAMQILPTPRRRPTRAPRLTAWLPVAGVAVAIVAAIAGPQLLGDSTAFTLSIAGVWGLVAVSTVIATGWTGQLSLGQFAIVGVSAVVAGNLIGGDRHVDLFLAAGAAVATGMIVAAVIGIPAMRIRGPFLGIATLAFAIVVDAYLLNPNYFPDLLPQDVERPVFLGRWPLEHEQVMLSLTLICLIGALVMAASVRATRSGRHLLATRDNPKGLEAFGASSKAAAMKGFVLSGAVAGLAGALHVMILHGVRLGAYQPGASVESFSSTTIGGLASLWGSVAATFGLRAVEDSLTPELRLVTMGLGVLVVLWLFPAGLAGVPGAVRTGIARLRHRPVDDDDGTTIDLDILAPATPEPTTVTEHAPVAAPRLASEGLEVSFGRLQVLFGIDLEVADGELLALLGTNGAGKSTWLRAVMGLTPSSGAVTLAGEDIAGRPTEELVRQGIALMMGGKSTFPTLTVDEHLRLAGWIRRHDHEAIAADRAEVEAMFPALVQRTHVLAGDLSGGEQQQLALAQTLMLRPDVLLIDELSLGLSPLIVGELMAVLRRLHEEGVTMVVVEQSVHVAMSVAQRAVFLEKGRVRYDGPTAMLLERTDLVRSIFFDAADAPAHQAPHEAPHRPAVPLAPVGMMIEPVEPVTVLACTGVRKRFGGVVAVDDVSLTVRAGEIVGLIGQNGAGKSTLLDCLSGFTPLDGGRIVLRHHDVDEWAPWERARAGLGRTFQEARLFPALTVAETVAVARERHVANRSMVADALRQPRSWESEQDIATDVERLLADCGLEPFRDALTSVLSTGTRRVVELACQLATEPTVLLLDEPSAGVAQREAEALAGRLLDLRDRTGAAMVIVEHDMGLLRSVCDRLVALELGAVIAEGRPEDVIADPKVIASYLGTDQVAIGRSGHRPLLATRQ